MSVYNKEYKKKYYQNNKWKISEREREYYKKNRENILTMKKEYYQRHKIKIMIYKKEHYQNNKEKIKKYHREYYQRNKERKKKYRREYTQKPEIKLYINKRDRLRKKEDFNYNIRIRLRHVFQRAMKNYSKTGKIRSSKKYEINYEAIIEHLKPFPKDIENYHVDHIIPLSMWDFNNLEHIKKAFASENHQWLTKDQNMWKGNRLVIPCFVKTTK